MTRAPHKDSYDNQMQRFRDRRNVAGTPAEPHTRSCYRRDFARLLAHTRKPLSRINLGDLQSFAQSLAADGLGPISPARTVAATRSLFASCHRMRYLPLAIAPSS
jgi:site-specific recombinase XerD